MEKSIVYVSMRDDNDLDCSYSIVQKDDLRIIIVLRDVELGVFDYEELKENHDFKYLLLKHYPDNETAYKDFMKIIGKMCKKPKKSKYFLNHKDEDNRMIYVDLKTEHMITDDEIEYYKDRFLIFEKFICEKADLF